MEIVAYIATSMGRLNVGKTNDTSFFFSVMILVIDCLNAAKTSTQFADLLYHQITSQSDKIVYMHETLVSILPPTIADIKNEYTAVYKNAELANECKNDLNDTLLQETSDSIKEVQEYVTKELEDCFSVDDESSPESENQTMALKPKAAPKATPKALKPQAAKSIAGIVQTVQIHESSDFCDSAAENVSDTSDEDSMVDIGSTPNSETITLALKPKGADDAVENDSDASNEASDEDVSSSPKSESHTLDLKPKAAKSTASILNTVLPHQDSSSSGSSTGSDSDENDLTSAAAGDDYDKKDEDSDIQDSSKDDSSHDGKYTEVCADEKSTGTSHIDKKKLVVMFEDQQHHAAIVDSTDAKLDGVGVDNVIDAAKDVSIDGDDTESGGQVEKHIEKSQDDDVSVGGVETVDDGGINKPIKDAKDNDDAIDGVYTVSAVDGAGTVNGGGVKKSIKNAKNNDSIVDEAYTVSGVIVEKLPETDTVDECICNEEVAATVDEVLHDAGGTAFVGDDDVEKLVGTTLNENGDHTNNGGANDGVASNESDSNGIVGVGVVIQPMVADVSKDNNDDDEDPILIPIVGDGDAVTADIVAVGSVVQADNDPATHDGEILEESTASAENVRINLHTFDTLDYDRTDYYNDGDNLDDCDDGELAPMYDEDSEEENQEIPIIGQYDEVTLLKIETKLKETLHYIGDKASVEAPKDGNKAWTFIFNNKSFTRSFKTSIQLQQFFDDTLTGKMTPPSNTRDFYKVQTCNNDGVYFWVELPMHQAPLTKEINIPSLRRSGRKTNQI